MQHDRSRHSSAEQGSVSITVKVFYKCCWRFMHSQSKTVGLSKIVIIIKIQVKDLNKCLPVDHILSIFPRGRTCVLTLNPCF